MISDTNIYEANHGRVQEILKSSDSLSAALFAAISVVERQIAVLQDLRGVFLASIRTKARNYEKEYPLPRNPFHENIVPTPVLSENPEQIYPGATDTIETVVREKRCSIEKIKELVKNTEIRRKFVKPSYENSWEEC